MNQVINGNNRTRNYYYTDRGELRQINFADGLTEKYRFDGNGNQTERINGNLETIGYTYDSVDNLTYVNYPYGTDTTIGYDNDGRQTVMYDGSGGSGWQYDWADNVTQLITPQGTMDYVYDQWNRQTKLTEGTIETNYSFTNEKLSLITKSSDNVATTLTYDNYGRLHWKNDGATKTEYGYDANDRVNSIAHYNSTSNAVLHQESYNFNPANNLNWKLVNSVLTSYTYDFIDQLKTENSSSLSNTYNYDNNGNRTNRISNAGTDTYTYDYGDKLTGISRSYAGSSTYTYDYCGRTSTIAGPGGTRIFNWDFEDRLTSISGGGVPSTTYGYNGVGSRVSKSNTQGSRTYKRNGVGVTAPVLSDGVATMVPGISEKSGGVTSTILSDRMGSMKGLSSSGAVTDTAEFDAFGKVVSRTGSNATQKGFAGGFGYQEDGESGYKLLGHRYYDADTGRFLSRDPIKDGGNWYSYCENNPLKAVDPTGFKLRIAKESDKDANGQGFSESEVKEIENNLAIMRSTEAGRKILEDLEKDDKDHVIKKISGDGNTSKDNPYADGKNIYIRLDRDYYFEDNDLGAKYKKFELWRLLAHELNHLRGYLDDGPNQMNNVEASENLIAKELKKSRRVSYRWKIWDPKAKKFLDGWGGM